MAMHHILLFFLIFLTKFCKSDDQLTPAKPLTGNDTLISESGDFALGFFSPTTSSKSFYLGIWYHGIPGPHTVVWIANRDDPIVNPSSATLTVTNNSHMVLSDSQGHIISKAILFGRRYAVSLSERAELMQCYLTQGTLSSGWKMVRTYGRASTIRPIHYFQP